MKTLPPGLAAAMFGGPPPETPNFGLPEAQRDRIAAIVARLQDQPTPNFMFGDPVRYIVGTGPVRKEFASVVQHMFWRYVETTRVIEETHCDGIGQTTSTEDLFVRKLIENMHPSEAASLPGIDCMIAHLNGIDGPIIFDLSCTALLEHGNVEDATPAPAKCEAT
jgi:hypothetical protein